VRRCALPDGSVQWFQVAFRDDRLAAPDTREVAVHRIASEFAIAVSVTAIMAAVVLFLGTAAPQTLADQGRADRGACVEAPLSEVSESGVGGIALLCIDRDGVRPVVQVRGLQESETYTAWLAYFDRPSACFHSPCGLVDLRGADPVGVLTRIDGAIAPPTRHLELRAVFRDLKMTPGSQVSLLILRQGPGSEADGRTRARQLLTPRMFDLGAPMAGALADRARGQLHAQAIVTTE